jgi:hypothetical protein
MFYSIFIPVFYYIFYIRDFLKNVYHTVILSNCGRVVQLVTTAVNKLRNRETAPKSAASIAISNVSTVMSLSEQYIDHKSKRFFTSYEQSSDQSRYNANVDEIFYTKSKWSELMTNENNYLERKWRTKILFENTPRGNVVMWYDAYQLGFAYYSDQNIPYSLLNAIAMKYVLVFCCRDFFMDENVLADKPPSKITENHNEEARQQKEQKTQNENSNTVKSDQLRGTNGGANDSGLKNGPFAKFKSYNNVSGKVNPAKTPDNRTESKPVEKKMNRFICLGKTRNASFTQKIEHRSAAMISAPATNSSLHENGIYSIFSQKNHLRNSDASDPNVSMKQTSVISEPGATPEITQPVKLAPNLPQKMSYAEYKKLKTEVKTAKS